MRLDAIVVRQKKKKKKKKKKEKKKRSPSAMDDTYRRHTPRGACATRHARVGPVRDPSAAVGLIGWRCEKIGCQTDGNKSTRPAICSAQSTNKSNQPAHHKTTGSTIRRRHSEKIKKSHIPLQSSSPPIASIPASRGSCHDAVRRRADECVAAPVGSSRSCPCAPTPPGTAGSDRPSLVF